MCLFIMALFSTNTSMAQSITANPPEVSMNVEESRDVELTVFTNGCRVINRWWDSSNPNVVLVTEVNYYSITNNVFGWILRLMGASPIEVGIATITFTVEMIDRHGELIIIHTSMRVSIMRLTEFQQAPPILINVIIGDAIKEDD